MAKITPTDAPLSVKVKGGKLVIEIGINTLAFAGLAENGGPMDGYRVIPGKEKEFAEDVVREIEREEGSFEAQPRIGIWLDSAITRAMQNGSTAVEGSHEGW